MCKKSICVICVSMCNAICVDSVAQTSQHGSTGTVASFRAQTCFFGRNPSWNWYNDTISWISKIQQYTTICFCRFPLFFSMRLRCIHISQCFCWHFRIWCLVSVMVQVIRRLERGRHLETISLHAEIRRYLKNKPLFSTPKIRLKMWKLDNLEPYKGETDSERWERWEREWKRMGPRTLNITSEAWHRSQ